MKYFIQCITTKYCCFSGRALRREFWTFNFISYMLIAVSALILGTGAAWLAAIIFLLPCLAVSARRLHDTGKSGILMIAPLLTTPLTILLIAISLWAQCECRNGDICFIDTLFATYLCLCFLIPVFILFYCKKGTPGENRFGPAPCKISVRALEAKRIAIRGMLTSGDIASAQKASKALLKKAPSDIATKIFLGTCYRLTGDKNGFARIHGELAPQIENETNIRPDSAEAAMWQKFDAAFKESKIAPLVIVPKELKSSMRIEEVVIITLALVSGAMSIAPIREFIKYGYPSYPKFRCLWSVIRQISEEDPSGYMRDEADIKEYSLYAVPPETETKFLLQHGSSRGI